jgi:hypothetical protein
MLASAHFKTKRDPLDDWFDPILNADTRLFIDPFLIYREPPGGYWSNAHSLLIRHFDVAFKLIAEGNLDPKTLPYKKALALLVFKEPKEFCLGYTAKGTEGLGSGSGYAKLIAQAIADAIKRGMKHLKHFEELGILSEGIGSDRISDMASTILKNRFVGYTQEIARRHSMHVELQQLDAARFDGMRMRFETESVNIPVNPFTQKPLLFVPKRFLRSLPFLNARAWWGDPQNEQLRNDVNYEILGRINKAEIVEIARANPEAVRRWTIQKEKAAASPYDVGSDPDGVWQWDPATSAFAARHPLALAVAKSQTEFTSVIETVIEQFRFFVEDQGGWELLWRKLGTEKPEHAAQLLFRGIASHYCKANNISLDAEVNLGMGPVDFKFSNGYSRRAHLEVKKLHNSKFWRGLEAQLPSYMKSDKVDDGWFLSIRYRDGDQWDKREAQLEERVKAAAKSRGLRIRYAIIDARPKKSASKL